MAVLTQAVLLCAAGLARAADPGELAVVLSSGAPYYREALEGFRETVGRPVTAAILTDGRPRVGAHVRVVAAFGAPAARESWSRHAVLITALAPGLRPDRNAPRFAVRVDMVPDPAAVVEQFRRIQPAARSIVAFWSADAVRESLDRMRAAAARVGLTLTLKRLDDPGDLPAALRGLSAVPDALWLPPDPALVGPASFAVLDGYARGNGVPLYAPTAGLAERGAAVAITASFREIGRAAGDAARRALAGEDPPAVVYPAQLQLVINAGAAARSGLTIPAPVLASASRVLP